MEKKLRVLFCAYDHPGEYVGGPNVWLSRTLPLLVELGFEVHLFLLANCEVADGALQKWLAGKGIRIHSFLNKFFTEDKIQLALKVVNEVKPDVYVPSLNLPACYASRWVKKAGVPTVGVLHSTDDFYIGLRETFLNNDAFRFSAMVGISSQLVNTAKKYGSDKVIYKYINYGTSVPEKSAKFDKRKLRLVYTGRIAEVQKRILPTTEVLCRLVKEVEDVEVDIIGDGPEREEVIEIIKKNNCEREVRFVGRVEPDKIFSHLLTAQIYVFLSDYEGLGLSLAEAMACGLVPICYKMPDDSGIYDLIIDRENGFLVSDRGDKFIGCIKKLNSDEGLWKKFSVSARKHIEENYDVKVWANTWKCFLLKLDKNTNKEKNWDELIVKKLGLPKIHTGFEGYDLRKTFNNRIKIFFKKIIWHLKKYLGT